MGTKIIKISDFHALQVGIATDVGRVRSQNQDSYGRFPDDALAKDVTEQLFIVADGMGGHADGRVASDTAVKVIGEQFYAQRTGAIPARLDAAFHQANKSIFQLVKGLPAGQIMGTTCTALVVSGDRAYVGHVGDSRMYRFHKGTNKQVTNDHSIVAEMVRKGILTSEEASHHPQRSMLERALGPESSTQVDAYEIDRLRLHDIFVLCSDGLGEVKMEEVGEIVADQDPQVAAEYLVDLANKRGGMDNTTVQVIRVVALDEPTESRPKKALPDLASMPAMPSMATPKAQTGVYSAFSADDLPAMPLPATQNTPSKKWFIPVLVFAAVSLVALAIWYNMSLLQTPETIVNKESYDEKTVSNQANNAGAGLGTTTKVDTTGVLKDNGGSSNNVAALPTITPTSPTSPAGSTAASATAKPSATNPTVAPVVQGNTNNATVTTPNPSGGNDKEPEAPKKSPLEIQLDQAKQKLNAGENDEAVSLYLALKAQNSGNDAVENAIDNAANTLMSRGDAARNLPDKALGLYQKSQQLSNSTTIQKRIEDIRKLIDN